MVNGPRSTVREQARTLARHHATADRGRESQWAATRERWRAVRAGEIRRLAGDFLAGREPLFADRAERGRVVAAGGGWVDGLDEATGVAAGLEAEGRAEDAALLLAEYTEHAGDPAPDTLRHHYLAWHALAAGHTERALRHLRQATVRLILVGGLPGSGKSTLSCALGDHLHAPVLSLRDQEHAERSYPELLRRAATRLGMGTPVVLDASWMAPEHRMAATDLARETHSKLVRLCCWAPKAMTARRGGPGSEQCAKAEEHVNPWPGAYTIITAGSPADSLTQALDFV
ncbi:AAA family ATPase [Prauserella flavalba]|uniref:AAA family ATPase n=1 Tax=Prauserella flavalba TaxID=1477506 RepID=UPI0036EC7548